MSKDIQQILESLLIENENEIVEFKEAKSNYDFSKLGKYFSALSNEANLWSHPNAWLIFGVNDKKKIIGTEFRKNKKDLNSLKSEIAKKTTDKITFRDIHEMEYHGKRVLLFEIPPAPKWIPVSWEWHYYARVDEELSHLDLAELEQIRKQDIREDWSIQTLPGATIEDLSKEAIEKAKILYKGKNRKIADEVDTWDDETFLNKAKLTIKWKITRTTILLLWKSESNHYLTPGTSEISWILKDKDNLSKDYQHFFCPLILSVSEIYSKIRNLKYRYMSGETLFPEEVDQYDPYLIREALNNCIAHQDYTLWWKILILENEDGSLIFVNSWSFIPKTVENVISENAPESVYRNKFLADAMVNLSLIDTIGSGIRKMFEIQKSKFFPLPEYDFSDNKVKVTIFGKVLDINYARKLAGMPNLTLDEIIVLDKIQKWKMSEIEKQWVNSLKKKGLVEWRYPNIFISSNVAQLTWQRSDYIKLRGFTDKHCKQMILDYLTTYTIASKQDIDKLVLDKLPDILDENQKKNKVKNIVYAMSRKDKTIINNGTLRYPKWQKSN